MIFSHLILLMKQDQGVPSHFQATLDQLEQLYDGLQLHYGNERLGKKWKLR